MKKNWIRLISALLAAVMILPAAAFAEDENAKNISLIIFPWDDAGRSRSYNIADDVTLSEVTSFAQSGDGSISLNEETGLVTAVNPGSVTLTAIHTDSERGPYILFTWYFEIIKESAVSIEITTPPARTSYISGQTFDPAGMVITAIYNNGDKATVPLEDCVIEPDLLTAETSKVTVIWNGLTDATPVSVEERRALSIECVDEKTEYEVGDSFLGVPVRVTYNDGTSVIITSGYEVSPETAAVGVTSYIVTFEGLTATKAVTVKEKEQTDKPSFSFHANSMLGAKTDYTVGEPFVPYMFFSFVYKYVDGKAEVVGINIIADNELAIPYVFTEDDISPEGGTTTITIPFLYENKICKAEFTELTVSPAVKKRLNLNASDGMISGLKVDLKKEVYPVWSVLTLDEIERLYGQDAKGNPILLTSDDLAEYAHTFALEVPAVDGGGATSRKISSKTRSAIEAADLMTAPDGSRVVRLRMYIDNDYFEFEVPSIGPGDVNGDGHVDSDDAIYLLRHTLNEDRYPINQSGDMNGDDRVDSDDAIYLLRHTLNPERYPLYNGLFDKDTGFYEDPCIDGDQIRFTTRYTGQVFLYYTASSGTVAAKDFYTKYRSSVYRDSVYVQGGVPASIPIDSDALALNRYVVLAILPEESADKYLFPFILDTGTAEISPAALKITKQPQDVMAMEGSTVTFSVEVAGGKAPYTYDWQWSDDDRFWDSFDAGINGSPSLVLTDVTAEQFTDNSGFQIRCVITDAEGLRVMTNTVTICG